eukprot:scaffold607802_cov38-Prasinocladus_malaysianus.AAC.1
MEKGVAFQACKLHRRLVFIAKLILSSQAEDSLSRGGQSVIKYVNRKVIEQMKGKLNNKHTNQNPDP